MFDRFPTPFAATLRRADVGCLGAALLVLLTAAGASACSPWSGG